MFYLLTIQKRKEKKSFSTQGQWYLRVITQRNTVAAVRRDEQILSRRTSVTLKARHVALPRRTRGESRNAAQYSRGKPSGASWRNECCCQRVYAARWRTRIIDNQNSIPRRKVGVHAFTLMLLSQLPSLVYWLSGCRSVLMHMSSKIWDKWFLIERILLLDHGVIVRCRNEILRFALCQLLESFLCRLQHSWILDVI